MSARRIPGTGKDHPPWVIPLPAIRRTLIETGEGGRMSLGGGIFLIVVGAILAFAIRVTPSWIDLQVVGYILMAAGIVVLIAGIVLMVRKRRSVVTTRSGIDKSGQRVQSTERRDDI
jgi:hypothetical protein